jgi:hypothetical protein
MTGAIVFLPLTQGQVTVIDFEDFDKVREGNWVAHRHGKKWSARGGNGKFRGRLLHRVLMDAPDGVQVDHQDRNPLNNRRYNLRKATPVQNQGNRVKAHPGSSSLFKGVSWHRATGKWRAKIQQRWLGVFPSEEEAARAYDLEAVKLFGEFATLNFPNSTETTNRKQEK